MNTPRKCAVDGCDGKYETKGFCGKHYQRMWKYGDVNTVKKQTNKYLPVLERFEMKVEIRDGSDCHWWTGANVRGYGQLKVNGKTMLAHRFAYERRFGKIPDGLFVCHKCDNPPCVNPDHLFTGTHQDNMDDRDSKNRLVTVRGERNGKSKLTEVKVLDIKKRLYRGEKILGIAKIYGVSENTIGAIKQGVTWRHVKIKLRDQLAKGGHDTAHLDKQIGER